MTPFYLDLSFESDLSFSRLLDSDLLVSSLTTSVDLDPPVAVFIGEGRSVDFSTLKQGYKNVHFDHPPAPLRVLTLLLMQISPFSFPLFISFTVALILIFLPSA